MSVWRMRDRCVAPLLKRCWTINIKVHLFTSVQYTDFTSLPLSADQGLQSTCLLICKPLTLLRPTAFFSITHLLTVSVVLLSYRKRFRIRAQVVRTIRGRSNSNFRPSMRDLRWTFKPRAFPISGVVFLSHWKPGETLHPTLSLYKALHNLYRSNFQLCCK